MPLTDRQIKTAKPAAKPYKLGDGGGLFLLVNPGGSKLWRLKYRYHGKEKLLSFGRYPDLTLQNARKARDEARGNLANGLDPSALNKAKLERAQRESKHTFSALASLYLSKQQAEGRAKSTLSKNTWLLEMAMRDFGSTNIENVKAPLILKTIRAVEARGTLETACKHRCNSRPVERRRWAAAPE